MANRPLSLSHHTHIIRGFKAMAMDLDEALIRLEAANTGSELIKALDEITAEAEAYAYIS